MTCLSSVDHIKRHYIESHFVDESIHFYESFVHHIGLFVQINIFVARNTYQLDERRKYMFS